MSVKLQQLKDWSEIAKNTVQIFALLIAGFWTYNIYGKKEAPSLEPIANTISSLNSYSIGESNSYKTDFQVEFKNTGISSFNISKVKIYGWRFQREMMLKDKGAIYVSLENIQERGTKFIDITYDQKKSDSKNTPFLRLYSPGTGYSQTLEWIVEKQENEEWFCFLIEFYRESDINPLWQSHSWIMIK